MQPLGEAAGQSGGFAGLLNALVNLTPILECPLLPPEPAEYLFARRRFKKPSASARTPALRARPCGARNPILPECNLLVCLSPFRSVKSWHPPVQFLKTAYT